MMQGSDFVFVTIYGKSSIIMNDFQVTIVVSHLRSSGLNQLVLSLINRR